MIQPVQFVTVDNASDRAYKTFPPGGEPYVAGNSLSQMLWSVVDREFGPQVADVLTKKLVKAVNDHAVHSINRA